MRIVLLGPPGAGKGTQAVLLSERQGVPCLSSGEILREAIRRSDPIGRRAKETMERGALVPDRVIADLILQRVARFGPTESFVLDGFPRTEAQARDLDRWLARNGHAPVDRAVDFEIAEDRVVQRLAGRRICRNCGANFHLENLKPRSPGICDRCGGPLETRSDDEPETIRKRLAVYRRETEPLLQFYRAQGKLRAAPGDLAIEAQYRELRELLKQEGLLSGGAG